MPQSPCWPRDTLKDYLNGSADDQRLEAIESHLSQCEVCEQTVLELEREPDTLLAAVREQVQEQPSQASQAKSDDDAPESVIKRAVDAVRELGGGSSAPAGALEKPGQIRLQQIGAYELLRPLGRGGMGLVMLARHSTLKKQVAIKILPSLIGDRPELVRRFQREILTAGQLSHPSIVHATDAGAEQGTHYLVMEYIDGLDLSRIARLGGPLLIADACEMVRQTALGLSYAHAQGVVHRDVKPSNLMLDAAGRVKILDFGLAQLSLWEDAACELTTVGQLMGTLDYMAPDQAERVGPVDYRADLYALGATLFRLITGRAPLAASPNMTLLEKVRLLGSQTPPLVSTLREDCPFELVRLIEQLLSRDPAARPASAAHVAEALLPFCSDHDLVTLLSKCRQLAMTEPRAELPIDSTPIRPLASLPSPPSQPPRRRAWITLAWLAPIALLAGIWITIETQKGQLVIESDVAGVKVNVLQDGKVYDQLQVHTGAQATRLFADKYSIEIDGVSDGIAIDQSTIEIRRGTIVVARITQKPATPTLDPEAKRAEILARTTGPLNWSRVPLALALQMLGDIIHYSIQFDEADLKSVGASLDSPTFMTVWGHSTDVDTALRLLLYKLKLAYTVTDTSIIVGSRERIEKLDGKPFTRWALPEDTELAQAKTQVNSAPAADPFGPMGSSASTKTEPMYAGQTLTQWLDVLERDIDTKTRLATLPAIRQLAQSVDADTKTRVNRALVLAINSIAQRPGSQEPNSRRSSDNRSGAQSPLISFVYALVKLNGPEPAFEILKNQAVVNEQGKLSLATFEVLQALPAELVGLATDWLLEGDRLQALDAETAWSALGFLEDRLADQEIDYINALPQLIQAQPNLGIVATLTLQPPKELVNASEFTPFEEAIARAARDAFLDDAATPEVVALAASRLALTTGIVETFREELVAKLKSRLEPLAKDRARLLMAFSGKRQSNLIANFSKPIKLMSLAEAREKNTSPILYVGSEVLSMLALVERLRAVREVDQPLAAVAETVYQSARPLSSALKKMPEHQISNYRMGWPIEQEQVLQWPKPYCDFPIEVWHAAKIVLSFNDLRSSTPLFDTQLSKVIIGFDVDMDIDRLDKDGDHRLSRAEDERFFNWGRDTDNDQMISREEMISLQEEQEQFVLVRDIFSRLDTSRDGKLTKTEAIPAISETDFAAMDVDSDEVVTVKECAYHRLQHPIAITSANAVLNQGTSTAWEARFAWAQRQVSKYDRNKDGVLTEDEWQTMIIKPSEGTDANADGKITPEEMATRALR